VDRPRAEEDRRAAGFGGGIAAQVSAARVRSNALGCFEQAKAALPANVGDIPGQTEVEATIGAGDCGGGARPRPG
jgi:hypothetical protein